MVDPTIGHLSVVTHMEALTLKNNVCVVRSSYSQHVFSFPELKQGPVRSAPTYKHLLNVCESLPKQKSIFRQFLILSSLLCSCLRFFLYLFMYIF